MPRQSFDSEAPTTPPCFARRQALSKVAASDTKTTSTSGGKVKGVKKVDGVAPGESSGLRAGFQPCLRRSIFLANFSCPDASSLSHQYPNRRRNWYELVGSTWEFSAGNSVHLKSIVSGEKRNSGSPWQTASDMHKKRYKITVVTPGSTQRRYAPFSKEDS